MMTDELRQQCPRAWRERNESLCVCVCGGEKCRVEAVSVDQSYVPGLKHPNQEK